jgi:hypothetical protein
MKGYKGTSTKSLTKETSIKELEKILCVSVLSAKGVIYTFYKNKRLGKKGTKLLK